MIEKKKPDELLTEIPEAWNSFLALREQQSPAEYSEDSELIGLRDLIAQRAYELFEAWGRVEGEDVSDWLKAEMQVRLLISGANRRTSETAKRRGQAASHTSGRQ